MALNGPQPLTARRWPAYARVNQKKARSGRLVAPPMAAPPETDRSGAWFGPGTTGCCRGHVPAAGRGEHNVPRPRSAPAAAVGPTRSCDALGDTMANTPPRREPARAPVTLATRREPARGSTRWTPEAPPVRAVVCTELSVHGVEGGCPPFAWFPSRLAGQLPRWSTMTDAPWRSARRWPSSCGFPRSYQRSLSRFDAAVLLAVGAWALAGRFSFLRRAPAPPARAGRGRRVRGNRRLAAVPPPGRLTVCWTALLEQADSHYEDDQTPGAAAATALVPLVSGAAAFARHFCEHPARSLVLVARRTRLC